MSQLLCYWEDADRCLNQGELKIKTHCPLPVSCCWSLVATVQHSCPSTNPFSVAFYVGKCHLLTGHPMSCFTSPGISDRTFVAPCEWCAKWWKIIEFKKFVKNCVLMNLYIFTELRNHSSNKNKKYYATGQLNP